MHLEQDRPGDYPICGIVTRGRGAIGRGLQPRARRYFAPVSARRSQPAVVLAVLPARLEIAAPAPPQRAQPDRVGVDTAYLCGLRHPRASIFRTRFPARTG